jgi:hypothetical protein
MPSSKGIPVALARVRKAVPPPGRTIESRKAMQRRRAKGDLRRELKERLAV